MTATTHDRPPHRARGGHDLQIRGCPCSRPDPFRSVRDLTRAPAVVRSGLGNGKSFIRVAPSVAPRPGSNAHTTSGFQERSWFTTRYRCYLPRRYLGWLANQGHPAYIPRPAWWMPGRDQAVRRVRDPVPGRYPSWTRWERPTDSSAAARVSPGYARSRPGMILLAATPA